MSSSPMVASGGHSGQIRLTSLSSGMCVESVELGDLGHVNKLAYSKEGSVLAGGGNSWVRLFDLPTMRTVRQLTDAHTENVTFLGFEKESAKWMVSAGEDGNVFVWDVRAKNFQMKYNNRGISVVSGEIHPNNGGVVFGDSTGYLNEWDFGGDVIVRNSPSAKGYLGRGISQVAISDDTYFMCHSNGIIAVFDKDDLIPETFLDRTESGGSTEDDTSPMNAIPPPISHPLMSRSSSALLITQARTRLPNDPEVVVNSVRVDPKQTFGSDLRCPKYVTSMTLMGPENLLLSSCDGSVSIWSLNEDKKWSLNCNLYEGFEEVPLVPTYWCWDAKPVKDENNNRYIVGAYSDGSCKLWDKTRSTVHPVSSFDCGAGQCVRSIAIVDGTDMKDETSRQRRMRLSE